MEPSGTDRLTYLGVAMALWLIVLGTVALALLAARGLFGDGSPDCDGYELDCDAWFADVDRDEAAADLVRCAGPFSAGPARACGECSALNDCRETALYGR